MDDCDICGRKTDTIYVVEVEGAVMNLCAGCARGKTPIRVIKSQQERQPTAIRRQSQEQEFEIVQDYGRRIRNARMAVGIPTKVLAERINEKESVLVRIENQKLLPDDRMIKKLERELNVRLTQEVKAEKSAPAHGPNEPLTLGDLAIRKDKK